MFLLSTFYLKYVHFRLDITTHNIKKNIFICTFILSGCSFFMNSLLLNRATQYIAWDIHAHLVTSKDGSVISRKSQSTVFKWSGI